MFGPNVTVHTVPATATIVPIHVRRVTIARLTSFEKSTYGHHTSAQVREWRATTACAKAHVSHKLHRLDRHHNRGSRKRKGREVEQRTGIKIVRPMTHVRLLQGRATASSELCSPSACRFCPRLIPTLATTAIPMPRTTLSGPAWPAQSLLPPPLPTSSAIPG